MGCNAECRLIAFPGRAWDRWYAQRQKGFAIVRGIERRKAARPAVEACRVGRFRLWAIAPGKSLEGGHDMAAERSVSGKICRGCGVFKVVAEFPC
jgi:hypothetical protein